MEFTEAAKNLINLKNKIKQTDKYCMEWGSLFPFWLSKNRCPFCGSDPVNWVPGEKEF